MGPVLREGSAFRDHLAACGAVAEAAAIAHFGDPAGERRAPADATTLHPLTDHGLLRVAGADAQAFLQGQLSNDIRELDAERAQLTTWCTPQGRVLASFVAWRADAACFLQLPLELLPSIRARLQRYVLRAKVEVDDVSDAFALLGVAGPQGADAVRALFPSPPAATMQRAHAGGMQAMLLRPGLFQLAVPVAGAAGAWDALARHARPCGTRGFDWHRVRACLPVITAATQDRFVPQMLDLEHLGAVSFSKGCYPGQEIVARSQYLGQVKRRLFRVHAADALLVPGQDFLSAGSVAGTVVNAAPAPGGGCDALAVLQLDAVAASLVLADGHAITVTGACH
jgi:folate-binding protein YgfZ